MEKEFNEFLRILTETTENIDPYYFQTEVANSDELKWRERVYCYELYHQLRENLGDDYQFKLAGEVDKNGHPIIYPALGAKKPDFIVHVPGRMDRNLAVIEVKPITVIHDLRKLRDDIDTLKGFIDVANYYRGIMIIYGSESERIKSRIISIARESIGNHQDRILLLLHENHQERLVSVNIDQEPQTKHPSV